MEPLNSSRRLVCEDLDQVWPGLVACGFEGIIVELLDAVLDLGVDLCPSQGSVDAGCGLRRVATEEACSR